MAEDPFLLSIVTPSFNRRDLLPLALESALRWLDEIGGGEIIVVDDGSTDGTAEMVRERFAGELASGRMTLHPLDENRGVTGAKNAGAAVARGTWLLFLDSDDALISEKAAAAIDELNRAGEAPILFFRCRDEATRQPIGAAQDRPLEIGTADLLHGWPWGDCVPAVRRRAFLASPYVEELRGFEGIAYARMTRDIAPLRLSPVVALDVRTSGADRLSSRGRIRANACLHARALSLMASEFRGYLRPAARLRYAIAIVRARIDCWRARRLRR